MDCLFLYTCLTYEDKYKWLLPLIQVNYII